MRGTVIAAAAIGAFSTVASAGVEAGDYGAPRIVADAPGDPAICHLGWPKLARMPGGAVSLSCVAASRHVGGRGRVATALSADGQAPFSPLVFPPVPEEAAIWEDMGNNAMGIASDGAVLLFAMAYTGVTANGILGWRSADGASWEPVDTSAISFNRTGSVFGHVIAIPGRGLALFGHTRPPDRPKGGIWMSLSADDGRSWGDPADICGRDALYEPDAVFSAGRIVLLARDDRVAGYMQFTSDDLGATWSGPSLVMGDNGPVHGHPSPFIAEDPDHPGRLLALQTRRFNFMGKDGARGEINLWTADAATLDWRKAGCIARIEGVEDYGYPSAVHLGGGRWLAVFYAGRFAGPNAIWGVEFTSGGNMSN